MTRARAYVPASIPASGRKRRRLRKSLRDMTCPTCRTQFIGLVLEHDRYVTRCAYCASELKQ